MAMMFQLFQLISYLVVIFDSLLLVTSTHPACYPAKYDYCPPEYNLEIRYCYYDETKGYQCGFYYYDEHDIFQKRALMSIPLKLGISLPCGFTGLFLIILYFYWKSFVSLYYSAIYYLKKKTKVPINVDVLLGSYGGHALQRYKYSDIKTMTYSFMAKLGQGGYGSVFKGTRGHDGRVVAVKILNESKGNGEEFINEVVTIGRTNHVNVVSLLGYCNEGKKRALVYEFMPNGSLEKFIYNENTSNTRGTHHLGWEKLYQIAVGIARGLEYLHCRCNTRIVHFDIKPHNILLDHDFCPKISDFGLAKLCPTRESVVSMIGTRGTWGYTAPEIGCRNLGDVSHKSDVYSYGMMVLEMIGGRKNLDVNVENISGIYFPHWIYNQLRQDFMAEGHKAIKVEDSKEIFKDETAKKMIIVALWCIQTHPTNRPSMTKVVEMLEGSNGELQMPPNPSLDPASTSSS
ncbi:Pr5-like receptor kinase [Thalictrum thalictroides]|uniref:Pr5-like receptor kinase n=1 Tax=Thalictrum thalictroides TaxID=46969 RepID=A0A7J6W8M3_THATH|nr:Pr5-like receptor kinase [Thalictrum thalictroides]